MSESTNRKPPPTFKQTQEFYRQVESGRINSENYQVFLADPDRFVETVVANSPLFEGLLAGCKQYICVSRDFTEKHFPLEPIAFDESRYEVYEYHFDKTINGFNAFKELERLGYRLLNGSRRAMEFVAEHPDIQLDHPLIVTAQWQNSNGCYVPVFNRDCSGRTLLLCGLGRNFTPRYGWLVLRRKQS